MWKKRCNTWVSVPALAATLLALLGCPCGAADLHDAVASGDLERVKQAISGGANVNQPDQMGATALHDAAWSGNREIALYLLEHGANVKARHAEGGSQPLAYACIKNDIPMVELLLAHGADVDRKSTRLNSRNLGISY